MPASGDVSCLNFRSALRDSDKMRPAWRINVALVKARRPITPRPAAHPWRGVFPALTTQMHRDGTLDLEGTARHAEAMIASGVSGLIFLGSLGENQTLIADEKRLVMREMVRAVRGRVPVLS